MSYLINEDTPLSSWIREEVELRTPIARGADGQEVRRVQEWLNLHRMGLSIDGDFGPVTQAKIKQFQNEMGIEATGIVDSETYQELVSPMRRVLSPLPLIDPDASFQQVVLSYARVHLEAHPREVGGQNSGPWVRMYMEGHDGTPWAWCAGFVKFLMKQAEETCQMNHVINGSFSCDSFAAQARNAGHLIEEADISSGDVSFSELTGASVFLVRRTSTDWTHTGIVTQFHDDFFDTIEGNTNDDGNREGYEVCARARGYKGKDFIRL
jgi:hypothetical protein